MRRAGFTILELLTVIAIVAILLGIGVGVFRKIGKRNELEAKTNAVRALIRHTRNVARDERAPAVVELDAQGGEVRALTRETLTLFRFEADQLSGDVTYSQTGDDDAAKAAMKGPPPEYDVTGSFGIQGHVVGADVTDGKLGQGLELRRPGAFVTIPDRPSLSPLEGVAVEAWILPAKLEDLIPKNGDERDSRPDAVRRAIKQSGEPPVPTPQRSLSWWNKHPDDPPLFTIVRKGKAFEVALTAGYALELSITGTDTRGHAETTYVARTEDLAVRPEKWARVALAFDGRDLACTIDGIRHALTPLRGNDTPPERLIRDRSPLVFSDPDPDRAFAGVIDEVKLSGILHSERVEIPKNMALLAPTPEIAFDALGALDPLRHPEPVVFWLSDAEEALKALEPPAPDPARTVERKKEKVDEAKGVTDREKLQRFSDLVSKVPENRAYKIAVELTGIVTGAVR